MQYDIITFHLIPMLKSEIMGKKESDKEMLFWTKEEYLKFADAMMDILCL